MAKFTRRGMAAVLVRIVNPVTRSTAGTAKVAELILKLLVKFQRQRH